MAVSYASTTPYKSDPYVVPMDLNLMGKVLSIKQEKFDRNAQSIQQGINQLGATDVLKQQDRDYLNAKINKIVTDVNNFGGVNLEDANVANQIQSMGSDVYNDKNVINAVAGTKLVRNLQEKYQEYKTNPKLTKLYSVANEFNDMQGVQQYLADPNVGATYNGTSTPTPYVAYKDNLVKNIQGVKANLTETYTPDGNLIYVDNEHREITPDRIVQMAKDLSTADEVGQMERDGLYQFRNIDPTALVQKAAYLHSDKIQKATDTLNRYNSLYLQATNDPDAKKAYGDLVAQQKKEVGALTSVTADDFVNKYKASPEEFKKNVYMDEFYRGLGNRFAYSENKQSIKPNYAEMFNVKTAQAERFHDDEMKLKYAIAGAKKNANGDITLGGGTNFTTEPANTQNPDDIKTGEDALNAKNAELTGKNTELMSNFLAGWANADPEVRNVLQSQNSPSGIVTTVKGQDVLENNNGIPGLQIEDFNVAPNSTSYNEAVKKGIPESQLKIMYDLYQSYQKEATGIENGVKDLPKGLDTMVEQIQLNNAAIKANNDKKQGINQALAAKYNLSASEINSLDKVDRIVKNNKKFQLQMSNMVFGDNIFDNMARGIAMFVDALPDSPEYNALRDNPQLMRDYINAKSKITGASYAADKKSFYDQIENRIQYQHAILGKDNLGAVPLDDSKKLFAQILSSRGDTQGKTEDVPIENVIPVEAGKTASGDYVFTAQIKSLDGKSIENKTVRLSPENIKQFGFEESPYQAISDEVNMAGRSTPKLISAKINSNIPDRKAPLRASIAIVKNNPNSNTDFTSYAQLMDAEGKPITIIPFTTTDRPDKSYDAAKRALQVAEDNGWSREEMIKFYTQNRHK